VAQADGLTSSAPLHDARVKAGAVLEKRESLSRARSRRRSAELPGRAVMASNSPAAKGRLVRRQAEKHLRPTAQLPTFDEAPSVAMAVAPKLTPPPPASADSGRAKPPVPLRPPPARLSSTTNKDDAAIVAAVLEETGPIKTNDDNSNEEVESDFYEDDDDDDDDDDDNEDDK
jgi:hypothetical protein